MARPDDSFHVYDTTLRDGAQREGVSYSVEDKLAVARLLDGYGVGFIEGGWPGAMPKDTEFFARAAKELSLRNAELVAFGATRKSGVRAHEDPQVRALLDSQAPVVTLVGDSESGGRFLSSVLEAAPSLSIVVNDALSSVDLSADPNLSSPARRAILGIALDAGDVALATGLVDCINLLTLAATSTDSDDARTFMRDAIPVSRGGSRCATFTECRALLEDGLNIDYDGRTGLLALTPNGDPAVANFVSYGFGDDGRAEFRAQIGVVSAP